MSKKATGKDKAAVRDRTGQYATTELGIMPSAAASVGGNEADDVTLLTQLLDHDNDENIILFDEEGYAIEMEQIGTIPHNGKLYALLRPLEADPDSAGVYEVDLDDEESITAVEDDALCEEIIALFNAEVE